MVEVGGSNPAVSASGHCPTQHLYGFVQSATHSYSLPRSWVAPAVSVCIGSCARVLSHIQPAFHHLHSLNIPYALPTPRRSHFKPVVNCSRPFLRWVDSRLHMGNACSTTRAAVSMLPVALYPRALLSIHSVYQQGAGLPPNRTNGISLLGYAAQNSPLLGGIGGAFCGVP